MVTHASGTRGRDVGRERERQGKVPQSRESSPRLNAYGGGRCPRCKMGRLFPGRYQGEDWFCFQCGHTLFTQYDSDKPQAESDEDEDGNGGKTAGAGCNQFGKPRRRFTQWIDRAVVKDERGFLLFCDLWRAWAREHEASERLSRIGGMPRSWASVTFRAHLGLPLSERIQDNDNPHGRNNRGWRGLRLAEAEEGAALSGDATAPRNNADL